MAFQSSYGSERRTGQQKTPFFYGWVIVAVSFITISLAWGLRFSFPVFYVAILDEFGWSRAATAGIFSVSILVYGISAPMVGALVDRFSPRKIIPLGAILIALGAVACSQATAMWQLYLWFGGFLSLASCFVGPVPHIAIISDWFVTKRGRALGIATAGMGTAFLFALLAQHLIDIMDWRQAFLIFGVLVVAIVVPLAAIFQRRRPQEMGLSPDGIAHEAERDALVVDREWAATEWTLSRAARTPRFWLLFCRLIPLGLGINLVFTHFVVFLVDMGYTEMFAAFILGFFGVMSAIGHIGGFISDRIGRENTYTLGSIGAALALCLLLLVTDASQPWILYLYAIVFGLSIGVAAPAGAAVAADLFQGRNFGVINGFIIAGFGIGGAIGPWLGGFIFDQRGSYALGFAIAAVSVVAACVMIWLAAPRKVRLVRRAPGVPEV